MFMFGTKLYKNREKCATNSKLKMFHLVTKLRDCSLDAVIKVICTEHT